VIGILSYGIGNIMAIKKVLDDLDIDNKIVTSPNEINNDIEKIIIPGVGAFDHAMKLLSEKRLTSPLKKFSENKNKFILGICVGMQLLANSSEEGNEIGLGLIPGRVKKFKKAKILPHVGWNLVSPIKNNKLFNNIEENAKFYFLHSYYFDNSNIENSIACTNYYENFSSVVHCSNIYGVQFHPEKSYINGATVLKNFANINEY
jgi:imidazole glycerol-phosphate synthase subunit HisH